MEAKNVLIRGAEQIEKINPMIIEAMDRLTPSDKVQIYYTGGLASETPVIVNDPDKFVGFASNVHKDNDGNYICDCIINDFLRAASNFDNVIDNMTVVARPVDTNASGNVSFIPTVEQFVIYDLDMKRQFDALMEQEATQGKLIEGDVPFPRANMNPFKDKTFNEEMHNVAEQYLKGVNDADIG